MRTLYLGFQSVAWLAFGLVYLAAPGLLEASAGVTASTSTGTTEIRAMYGGLPIGIGALAGLALRRERLVIPALVMLAFTCAGLGAARISAAVLVGDASAYTLSCVGFEGVSAGVAAWLLARETDTATLPGA